MNQKIEQALRGAWDWIDCREDCYTHNRIPGKCSCGAQALCAQLESALAALSEPAKVEGDSLTKLRDMLREELARAATPAPAAPADAIDALKFAYRKHHLMDDSIGWDELSTKLENAFCNAIGDDAFVAWLSEVKP